jgi:predicted DsbA family dithiol-disulfide isomerase
MIQIDIFSDTICPWCLIGKRRLEKALALRPDEEVKITWRAFQLNPDMPAEGMDRQSYLRAKFGGSTNADAIYAPIRETGETEGIPFDFAAIKMTPNSLDSHRLIRYTAQMDLQDKMVERLFSAYFFEGKNIGDRDVLSAEAAELGLDREEVRGYLHSDINENEMRAEDAFARKAGIRGVPCFVFNGRHALSGAQAPEVFLQLFDLAKAEPSDEVAANAGAD